MAMILSKSHGWLSESVQVPRHRARGFNPGVLEGTNPDCFLRYGIKTHWYVCAHYLLYLCVVRYIKVTPGSIPEFCYLQVILHDTPVTRNMGKKWQRWFGKIRYDCLTVQLCNKQNDNSNDLTLCH